ncbi:hypothetical protein [Synechococcus sp. A15-24]|uniref:hypothetical protein n=1 Tax=Synechococcus sp. A15-24 TaxID=1050635 RepID=UPI001648BC98|nr:hypothetical protein [Synechococcus sp. A15-24]
MSNENSALEKSSSKGINYPFWFKKDDFSINIQDRQEIPATILSMEGNKNYDKFVIPSNFNSLADQLCKYYLYLLKISNHKNNRQELQIIPNDTILKAIHNYHFAENCCKIVNSLSMQPITIFETGPGAGFLAPLLISNIDLERYIHFDVYQPYFSLQSIGLNYSETLNNEYHHYDLSQSNQKYKDLADNVRFQFSPESTITATSIGLPSQLLNPNAHRALISIPWWHINDFKESDTSPDLWIANGCLQEMDKKDFVEYINMVDKKSTENSLLLVCGTGATRDFYLVNELIQNSNLYPIVMAGKNIPFLEGERSYLQTMLFAHKNSIYFKDSKGSCNNELFFKSDLMTACSRSIVGEFSSRVTMEHSGMYIHPQAYFVAKALFKEIGCLPKPKSTGLYIDSVEQTSEDEFTTKYKSIQ